MLERMNKNSQRKCKTLINPRSNSAWVLNYLKNSLYIVCSECSEKHTAGVGGVTADNETELRVSAHALGWALGRTETAVCPRCLESMMSGRNVVRIEYVEMR